MLHAKLFEDMQERRLIGYRVCSVSLLLLGKGEGKSLLWR